MHGQPPFSMVAGGCLSLGINNQGFCCFYISRMRAVAHACTAKVHGFSTPLHDHTLAHFCPLKSSFPPHTLQFFWENLCMHTHSALCVLWPRCILIMLSSKCVMPTHVLLHSCNLRFPYAHTHTINCIALELSKHPSHRVQLQGLLPPPLLHAPQLPR